ncbi:hypothetical protein DM02DRAFT_408103 [Periconia macrospinosa]|uniref:Uncharacterized protein n=1 Tax=Periconia macrospinosa TaxID=97972 RepID=A0A2V1EAU6_9PLEO|nr:hypothetical protein DM02DRAFT_408103 [Periconia macrospinosa]
MFLFPKRYIQLACFCSRHSACADQTRKLHEIICHEWFDINFYQISLLTVKTMAAWLYMPVLRLSAAIKISKNHVHENICGKRNFKI